MMTNTMKLIWLLFSNEIPVKKVTLETFRRLLEYIYRDHIAADMSKAVATQLSQVAKAFRMERLQAMCDSFLEREVDLIPKSSFSEDMKTILNDPNSGEVKFSFPLVPYSLLALLAIYPADIACPF